MSSILPFLQKAPKALTERLTRKGRMRTILWVVLHVVFLIAMVLVLWYVNRAYGLGRVLRSRWPALHAVWLPLLFLLVYALGWLGWWLWRLLGPDRGSGDFPDIDADWAEAVAALDQAGAGLTEVPVFLLLGGPPDLTQALFAGAGLSLRVRHVPPRPDASLHVYGGPDGIFVTSPGASRLGQYAARLAEQAAVSPPLAGPLAPFENQPAAPAAEAAGPAESEMPAPSAGPASPSAPGPGGATAAATAEMDPLAPFLLPPEAVPGRRPAAPTDPVDTERQTARLKYLCRLLGRDRRPFCPVNGILLLLPLAACENARDAAEAGEACAHDLAAAREALRLDCPRFALVYGLEVVSGFAELVQQLVGEPSANDLRGQWLLGQHFPLVPDVAPAEVPAMIRDGVRWLGETLLPALVYKLLRVEGPGMQPDRPTAWRGDVHLYWFLQEVRGRLQHLGRLLARTVAPEAGPPLFGGCYLAGTGADAQGQAFLAGVFRRLIDNQNAVSWTADALVEEANYRRWTRMGYLWLGALAVGVILLAVSWLRAS
jgi:hypothetical protein